jgi:hypothetical protein
VKLGIVGWAFVAAVVTVAVFVAGLFVGGSRGKAYQAVRSISDQLRESVGSPADSEGVACVLVGDSLIARGDWQLLNKAGYLVTNLGVGGARSEHLQQIFQPAVAHARHETVIWIGANDVLGEVPLDESAARIGEFAKRCSTRGRVLLVGVPPFGQKVSARGIGCRELNRRLESLANEQGYLFCNTANVLEVGDEGLSWGTSFDGIHLSREASRRVAQEVARIFKSE